MQRLLLVPLILTSLQACFDKGGVDELAIRGMAVADLDQDGAMDIVGIASDIEVSRGRHIAYLLINDINNPGNITLRQKFSIPGPPGTGAFSIAVGDLNHDGFADIAIQHEQTIYLLQQKPASPGSFEAPVGIANDIPTFEMAIADLNQDGYGDIALFGYAGESSILFQDSMAAGRFLPRSALGTGAKDLAIGDLDGDLINDLAIIDQGQVKLLLQDQGVPGNFIPADQFGTPDQPDEIALADLDQDTRLDVVVKNSDVDTSASGSLGVWLQDDTNPGTFPHADHYGHLCIPHQMAVADLNHDGSPDLAVITYGDLCTDSSIDFDKTYQETNLFFQIPATPGLFSPPFPLYVDGDPINPFQVADFNNDGYNDLVSHDDNIFVLYYQNPASPGSFLGRTVVYDPN